MQKSTREFSDGLDLNPKAVHWRRTLHRAIFIEQSENISSNCRNVKIEIRFQVDFSLVVLRAIGT